MLVEGNAVVFMENSIVVYREKDLVKIEISDNKVLEQLMEGFQHLGEKLNGRRANMSSEMRGKAKTKY